MESPDNNQPEVGPESPLVINQAQLILAEKRTSLAALRTGLAVLGLPLALVSFLIAASSHYDAQKVAEFLVVVLGICACLISLGAYLLIRAVVHLHRHEANLRRLRSAHGFLSQVMD